MILFLHSFIFFSTSIEEYPLVKCSASSNVFNLCFLNSSTGKLIRTTYSDVGYGIRLRVDSKTYDMNSGTCTFEGIQFKTDLTDVNGKGVHITYSIYNAGNVTKIVSFAVHADSYIGTDSVPIAKLSNMEGLKFEYNNYQMYMRFQKYDSGPPVDSLWIGEFDERFYNLWNNSTASSIKNIDSGFAYSIQNKTILPQQRLSFATGSTNNPDLEYVDLIPVPTSIFFTKSDQFTCTDFFTKSDQFTPTKSDFFYKIRYIFTNIIIYIK